MTLHNDDYEFEGYRFADLVNRRIVSSRTDLQRKQEEHGFPRPVYLGGRQAWFPKSEVESWVRAQIVKRDVEAERLQIARAAVEAERLRVAEVTEAVADDPDEILARLATATAARRPVGRPKTLKAPKVPKRLAGLK